MSEKPYSEKHCLPQGEVAWQQFGKEWMLTGQYGHRPIFLAPGKKGIRLHNGGLLVDFDPDHPFARLLVEAINGNTTLRRDLDAARAERDEAVKYREAVRTAHNGYILGPEPLSPQQAIHELIEEANSVGKHEAEILAEADSAALRARVAALEGAIAGFPSAWRAKCRECLAAGSGFTFEQERGGEHAAYWFQDHVAALASAPATMGGGE